MFTKVQCDTIPSHLCAVCSRLHEREMPLKPEHFCWIHAKDPRKGFKGEGGRGLMVRESDLWPTVRGSSLGLAYHDWGALEQSNRAPNCSPGAVTRLPTAPVRMHLGWLICRDLPGAAARRAAHCSKCVHLDGLNAENTFTPHYTLYNCVCDK